MTNSVSTKRPPRNSRRRSYFIHILAKILEKQESDSVGKFRDKSANSIFKPSVQASVRFQYIGNQSICK